MRLLVLPAFLVSAPLLESAALNGYGRTDRCVVINVISTRRLLDFSELGRRKEWEQFLSQSLDNLANKAALILAATHCGSPSIFVTVTKGTIRGLTALPRCPYTQECEHHRNFQQYEAGN